MFPFGEAMSNTESVFFTCSSLMVISSRSGVMILPIDAVAVDSTIGRLGESLVLIVRVLLMVDVVDMVSAVRSLFCDICPSMCILPLAARRSRSGVLMVWEREEKELAYPWRVRSGCLLELLNVVFLLSMALFTTGRCQSRFSLSIWRRRCSDNGGGEGSVVQGNSVGGLDMPRVVPLARWVCAELVSPQWMRGN